MTISLIVLAVFVLMTLFGIWIALERGDTTGFISMPNFTGCAIALVGLIGVGSILGFI